MLFRLVPKEEKYEVKKILKKLDAEMMLRGFSAQTSKIYLFYNEKFLDYIKKVSEEVTEEDIKEFISHKMKEDFISNSSIALIKAYLSITMYFARILL